MDIRTVAEEIMEGRRIGRRDDLELFLECGLKELGEGADRIRSRFVGERVDLCSIIRTANIVHSPCITIPAAKYMSFSRRRPL